MTMSGLLTVADWLTTQTDGMRSFDSSIIS